jgi:hypothetical protein
MDIIKDPIVEEVRNARNEHANSNSAPSSTADS